LLSVACLIISIAAAVGSIAGIVLDLKVYKPFKTIYWFNIVPTLALFMINIWFGTLWDTNSVATCVKEEML
jgi:hypothetical protein